MNLQTLKTELTTDPLGRGYAAMSDVAAADSLNKPDRQPNRETLDVGLLVASIVGSDLSALTPLQKELLTLYTRPPTLTLTSTVRTELAGMFLAGSVTRENLVALLKRPGSRAEELGLPAVTPSHVADARRL